MGTDRTSHLPTDVRGVERADDRRVISGIVHVLKSAVAGAIARPSMDLSDNDLINRLCALLSGRGRRRYLGKCSGLGWTIHSDTQMYSSTQRESASLGSGREKGGAKQAVGAPRRRTRRYTHFSQILKGAFCLAIF